MATGIFSTTRVASEGLALALVSAALAGITAARLTAGADNHGGLNGVTHAQVTLAAQRLATGDLNGASAWLPGVPVTLLRQHYADAFHLLTHVLAAITALAALATLHYLGSSERRRASSTPSRT